MKMIAAAVVAVIAAMAAAGFAWQKSQALEGTKAELANARSQLQKASDDVLAMRAETTALRKEFAEQKLAADRSRAELATAQVFLDAEKAAGARLREELMKAKAQLASTSKPRSVQGAPVVRRVPAQPMVIRVVPSGSAVSNPSPSSPAVGYGVPAR